VLFERAGLARKRSQNRRQNEARFMATTTQAIQTDRDHKDWDHEDDWRLPGLELMHDFQISLGHWSLVSGVVQSLRDANAEVHTLSLSQQPNMVSLRCRVKAISARRARALAAALCGACAISADVEHLMLAKGVPHVGA
jgi:hypothetical protein